MQETPITIKDIDAAQDAAFVCLNCLGYTAAFPEVFTAHSKNTRSLSSTEQALDAFDGMLTKCCGANKPIERVKTLLVGEKPVSFHGNIAECAHMLSWELVMDLRSRLDAAGTGEFQKLHQPGEDAKTVQAKVKKLVEIRRQKQVQIIRSFPLPQLLSLHLDTLIRHEHDRALRRFQERPEVSKVALRPLPLMVDLACKTIAFDGETHDISSDTALRWVKVLADHPNEWLSSTDLCSYDPELLIARTDRLRRFLPDTIQRLLHSKRGKGTRIRL